MGSNREEKWPKVVMLPILVLLDTEPIVVSPVSGPCGECLPSEEAVLWLMLPVRIFHQESH